MAGQERNKAYVDYAKYLQEQIDAKNGDFNVYAERNLDSHFDGEVVVVARSGKYYRSSAEIPYQIEIFTSSPEETINWFTELFKELNNTKFTSIVGEGQDKEIYTITQFYQTPTIIDPDIEIGSDHYARIIAFASLYITYNVSDIQSIKIDGEEIEFENISISYSIEPHSVKKSGVIVVKSKVRTNTTSISFQAVNKNTIFFNKVFNILFHQINANTTFNVEIKMTNGLTGELVMILSQSSLNGAKNALPGENINLIEYDPGETNNA